MRIIESRIIGKHSPDTCEDGIATSRDFIAVVDGSTGKTPRRIRPEISNGRYAMQLICAYINHMEGATDLDAFLTGITQHIAQAQGEQPPEDRLTASAIVYARQRREIWMIGDCLCLVDGQLYTNPKPYEQRIAEQRACLIRNGMPPAEARQHIVPELVRAMRDGQNKTYAVIDGTPVYKRGIKVLGVLPGQEVVLASDGYSVLKPTLRQSEACLSRLLHDDPQCIGSFVATKGLVPGNRSFDDRAYIRFVADE